MASKEVLKYGDNYIPNINDNATSDFGAYETYSRNKIDDKLKNTAAYDWSGKNIAFEGESITFNGTMGYPEYVAEQTGINVTKIAIAGVPIMGNYPGKAWDFRRRVSNIPVNSDAIIILGDCNAIDTTMGDEYSNDITKWAGRWNVVIDAIKRSFPTVPLFLVSEYPMKNKDKQNRNVPVLFRALAQRYGAKFICLAEESPLSLVYAADKWGLTTTDGVHCSHEAMPLFADVIIKHLKETPFPEWENSDTLVVTTSQLSLATGATANIEYSISGDLSIQWTTDNPDVACVMGGVVYGMSAGSTTITATTRNGNVARCSVTVTE